MKKNIHSLLHRGEAKNKINMRIHLSRGKHTELYEQIIVHLQELILITTNQSSAMLAYSLGGGTLK